MDEVVKLVAAEVKRQRDDLVKDPAITSRVVAGPGPRPSHGGSTNVVVQLEIWNPTLEQIKCWCTYNIDTIRNPDFATMFRHKPELAKQAAKAILNGTWLNKSHKMSDVWPN
jgi:hypothetical protein